MSEFLFLLTLKSRYLPSFDRQPVTSKLSALIDSNRESRQCLSMDAARAEDRRATLSPSRGPGGLIHRVTVGLCVYLVRPGRATSVTGRTPTDYREWRRRPRGALSPPPRCISPPRWEQKLATPRRRRWPRCQHKPVTMAKLTIATVFWLLLTSYCIEILKFWFHLLF